MFVGKTSYDSMTSFFILNLKGSLTKKLKLIKFLKQI